MSADEVDLDTELRLLVENASTRNGRAGVPAGWITPYEVLETLNNGYATCGDCDGQIVSCLSYCNGAAHCVCQQPVDCKRDEHLWDEADRMRAEAKEGLR